MTKGEIDIVSATQATAKNLYELMMQLATRIDELQKENAELKAQLGQSGKE